MKKSFNFNIKLLLPVAALIAVFCVNVLTVTTYAIWSNRLNNSKFMVIKVEDENPSLKYQLFLPLGEDGERLPGTLNITENTYTLGAGYDTGEVYGFGLVGWTGNLSVVDVKVPETHTMTVNGEELTYGVYAVLADAEFSDFAFRGNKVIESLFLPKSLRKIESGVFSFMEELKTLTIDGTSSDGVVEIGDYAFACCYSLTTTSYLPNRVSGNTERIFIG